VERNAPAAADRDSPKLLELFFTFARVSLLTIGGGYVMFPLLKRDLVDSKGWISTGELIDSYAVGQSVPGIIAINTVTLIGFRKRGIAGAIASAMGMAAPSLVVILLIAAFLQQYFDHALVQKAFAGIRASVVAMIGMAIWQVGGRSFNSVLKVALAIGAFLAMTVLNCSPVLLIVIGSLLGLLLFRKRESA